MFSYESLQISWSISAKPGRPFLFFLSFLLQINKYYAFQLIVLWLLYSHNEVQKTLIAALNQRIKLNLLFCWRFFFSFCQSWTLNWGHTNWSNPILLPESIWMEKTLFEIALYSISPQLKRNKKHLEFKWSWKIDSKIEPQEIREKFTLNHFI